MDDKDLLRILNRMEGVSRRSLYLIPQEVEAQTFIHRLLEPHRMTPAAGGWAANYTTLAAMLDHLTTVEQPLVYDFGGGVSTLYFALFAKKFGGHVISIDHDDHFIGITRTYLDTFGVSDCATLVHAPIVNQEGGPWYDRSAIPLRSDIDLVFVDGPLGSLQPKVRRHALPFVVDHLATTATVAIDDTDRPDEREIADDWIQTWSGRLHHLQGNLSCIFHVERPDRLS
ncbi:class I SAM-dependent methyltransferase [Luteococcus sp.]|uniref:class I SAM-dependent methyltransferase n=1 Tax=Luteococcus sp. TaxID=1969402 RepID=UPI00373584EE